MRLSSETASARSRLFRLERRTRTARPTTTKVNLHADGSAECSTKVDLSGDNGLGARLSFRGLQTAQLRPGFQNMVSGFSPNASLVDYSLSPLADRDQPVVLGLSYHAPLWATRTGHLLIIDGKDMTSAPYDRASRTFPIYESQTSEAVQDLVVTLLGRLHLGRQTRSAARENAARRL